MEVDAFVNKCSPVCNQLRRGEELPPTIFITKQHTTCMCNDHLYSRCLGSIPSISSVRSLTISLRCPSLVGSAEPNTRIEVRGRVYSRGLAPSRRRAGLDANGAEATYIIPHNTRRRRPEDVYFSVSSVCLSYSPGYGTEPLRE